MADEILLALAADIVSAHVTNNSVSATELPKLISSVYASLSSLGQEEPAVEEKREPAVSIRASVKPDAITCLECGARLKMLKRHLATEHDLTPAQYKARWKLNSDYPIVAPEYASKRKELAVRIGLGRKSTPVVAPAPKARKAATPKVEKAAIAAPQPVPAPETGAATTKRSRKKVVPAEN